MPTNHTTNYQLSQWERTDQVRMEDFNADNAKLDTALAAQAETLAAHTQALSKLGNCQVYTTTYVGSGKSGEDNPTTLTFPHKPLLVIVAGPAYSATIIMPQGAEFILHLEGNNGTCHATWYGNSVSWYSTNGSMIQMSGGVTYHVVAFLSTD